MIGGFSTAPFGLRIVESPAACTYEPVRRYPHSRAKSDAHWRRMDKKWRKRYGMRMVPQCYQMFDTLVVHPMLADDLRNTLKNAVGAG